ncbi:MAG: hypothetical protein ABSG28_07700, partial [Methanoregula sp.]|uniref:hypothetical protein n=1 Tax=Methanoregula sp. TaxID=2052170 RepID=UPI003C23A92D
MSRVFARLCPCYAGTGQNRKKQGNCKTSAPKKIMGKSNTQSIEVKRFKNMRNPLSGAPPPPL